MDVGAAEMKPPCWVPLVAESGPAAGCTTPAYWLVLSAIRNAEAETISLTKLLGVDVDLHIVPWPARLTVLPAKSMPLNARASSKWFPNADSSAALLAVSQFPNVLRKVPSSISSALYELSAHSPSLYAH